MSAWGGRGSGRRVCGAAGRAVYQGPRRRRHLQMYVGDRIVRSDHGRLRDVQGVPTAALVALSALRRLRIARRSPLRVSAQRPTKADTRSFLNTCVGERTYTSFLAFLVSTTFCILLAVGFSIAHTVLANTNAANGVRPLSTYQQIGSLIVAIAAFFLGLPVIGLLGYHVRLLWLGRTTIEMVRSRVLGLHLIARSSAIDPSTRPIGPCSATARTSPTSSQPSADRARRIRSSRPTRTPVATCGSTRRPTTSPRSLL